MEENAFTVKRKPQILASLAATIGAFGLGTVIGWSSPAFPSLDATRPFHLTNEDKSWLACLALLGAAISSPIVGICLGLLGRKMAILMTTLPFCVGWLIMSLTAVKLYIFIGRFITGFCGGALIIAIPLYVAEVSEGALGARLVSLVEVALTLGILFSFSLGAFVAWSWLGTMCALFPLLSFVLLYCMPETPRYLLSKGQLCRASRNLSWLRGAGFSLNVDVELQEIRKNLVEEFEQGGICRDLCTWSSIKCLLICLVLIILQQFSGVYPILFHLVYIFQDTKTSMNVHNAAMAVGIINVLATFLSTGQLDKSGRKRLVIVSELAMASSLGLLGAYFYFPIPPEFQYIEKIIDVVPLLCLCTYMGAYSIGLGPVPWIIMREMFPLGSLGFAATVAASVSWGLAVVVTYYFNYMKQELGNAWCFWTFGIICATGAAFILCIVPETKGKTVDEIRKGIGKRGIAAGAKVVDNLKFEVPPLNIGQHLPGKWWKSGEEPNDEQNKPTDAQQEPELSEKDKKKQEKDQAEKDKKEKKELANKEKQERKEKADKAKQEKKEKAAKEKQEKKGKADKKDVPEKDDKNADPLEKSEEKLEAGRPEEVKSEAAPGNVNV